MFHVHAVSAIVRAMRLGRRIFDNLRKSMFCIPAVHVPMTAMALLPVLLDVQAFAFAKAGRRLQLRRSAAASTLHHL